jgi:hypothetical protein
VEHDTVFILVLDLRRNLTIDDFLEDGFAHGIEMNYTSGEYFSKLIRVHRWRGSL